MQPTLSIIGPVPPLSASQLFPSEEPCMQSVLASVEPSATAEQYDVDALASVELNRRSSSVPLARPAGGFEMPRFSGSSLAEMVVESPLLESSARPVSDSAEALNRQGRLRWCISAVNAVLVLAFVALVLAA